MPDTFFRNEKIGESRLQYNVFLIDSSGQEKLSREIGFFFFDLFNILTLKRYSRKFIVFFQASSTIYLLQTFTSESSLTAMFFTAYGVCLHHHHHQSDTHRHHQHNDDLKGIAPGIPH